MSTLQVCGQLLRPAQETGIKKAEPLTSYQQTPIQHSPKFTMSNGYSLYGSDGANFSRLTEHLVFAFLGGYVSMDDLPCLGDLANAKDGFHRTTFIPMDSQLKSSQVESLKLNGNLHQLSAISMDLDFNPRIVDYHWESVKNSKCYQKSVETISILLETFDASSTAFFPPEHTSQRADKIELLPKSSMNAHLISNKSVIDILNLDHPTPSMLFQQCDLTGKFVLSTIDNGSHFDSLDSKSVSDTPVINSAFKLQKNNVNQTTEIQEDALIHHHHDLNSGNVESQFHRHHKSLNGVPVSNLCSTNALTKNGPINNGNTFSIPNPGTLMDYLYGDLEIPQFLDTESSSMQLEDLCCTIGNYGKGPTYSVPDPSQLMNLLYGDLESPVFLSSESIEEVVYSISKCADRYAGRSSEGKLTSQSADHAIEDFAGFAESYQCSAMHSTWPEKMITVSEGQTQKPLTCLIPNLTKDHTFNGILTADPSLFHSNTDKTSVMNKNRTDEIYERNSENSVSLCHLNQMECDVETLSSHHDFGSTDCVHSCSDDSGDSIEHQSLKNDFEFAFPDPSTLKDFSYGSLDSPKFLASEILDGKIDNLQCPSSFGGCELDYRTEKADLSDRMIFDQFHEGLSKDDSPINILQCLVELLDLSSSSFDISDHGELLEWYGIDDQDQFMGDDWTCDSPTWPGKI